MTLIRQEPFQEWNMMFRMLIQATCGGITPNMRLVGLRKEGGSWIVEVVLERDDAADLEQAKEFASDLWSLSECYVAGDVRSRVIVSDGDMIDLPRFDGLAGPLFIRSS